MATQVSQAQPGGLRFEDSPKWVRTRLGSVDLADSKRPRLVWEPRRVVPVYAFPEEDVRMDLLRPSDRPDPEAHEGTASRFWALAGGGDDYVAWAYDDPDLADYVAIRWDATDAWYEEDERVLGHPRDPFKRIDVRQSSRHVRVEVDGHALADTRLARLLFETGHPTRYYLPPEDVRRDLLRPSPSTSFCAYKGQASYWSASVGDRAFADIAWTYRDPLPDNDQIRDLVCFFNEKVDLYVDGESVTRPETQWS
ncbi:MAG: DUF427 domain-containing protein [Actinomycetota bacterium]|nr:DUF427 domain-containing protein [Actinomycetota bacterium]